MKRSLYMKILVPIDGSEYSHKALLHACDLAKNQQSSLIILYVIEKSILNILDKKEYNLIVKNFGEKVLEKSRKICIEKGVDSKTVLKKGNIVDEIIKFARNENCNLIIIGSKGLGATARLLLGSVSQKLVVNSPCSILVVK